MDSFENFDRDFNRMRKFVICFIASVLILIVLSLIGMGVFAIFAAKEINDKGLKGVAERVWNGKSPNSSDAK